MSIREINDQYKEYADPYEPVKGKKPHDGIIISQKKRMQQAAKNASVTIVALGMLSIIVLNLFFHLSAEIIHHSATAHEATVSFVVDTSDFDQAGVYYILTAPDGNPVATAPVNAEDNTAYFEQLEENTDYLFTLYDKNGNPLQSQIVTTADDPSPIPEILSLTASYDRTTETVTIHGEIQTNDAENFNAALSASDFPMDPDTVSRTGSGAAMTFRFSGNGGQEITDVQVLVNGTQAAAMGYTITNHLVNAEGTVTVSGPFSGYTEVTLNYGYILGNTDYRQSGSTSGYLDIGYFSGFELSGITVIPNGDGTANVTGTITSANTAPVVINNIFAKAIGADATEYPGNSDYAPAFDSGTNTGTFTIAGIPLPPSGDYTVSVEASGYPSLSYPYSITIHGSASVTQTVTP